MNLALRSFLVLATLLPAIAATPECQEWWHHMADLMPHNTDHSPVAEETLEVFHLD